MIQYSNTDIIIRRGDDTNILTGQGKLLINYLPNWNLWQHTKISNILYSPVLTSSELESEIEKIQDAISKLITKLNSDGKTITRIECGILECDDIDTLNNAFPQNTILDTTTDEPIQTFNVSKDFDYNIKSSWVFSDICADNENNVALIYGNKFYRNLNKKFKIRKRSKKNYILKIESSWGSI